MYEIKSLNFGFIVLCSDMNPIALSNTVKSLKLSHAELPVIAVVPSMIRPEVTKEMKKTCNVYKGKDTITSLMNTGLRNSTTEWNIFVMAGTWVKLKIAHKLSRFIKNENDVLFPIVDKIHDFKNGTLNGLCINKKTFKKVGQFPEEGSIAECKEEWAVYAAAFCDAKFKAILGAQIC